MLNKIIIYFLLMELNIDKEKTEEIIDIIIDNQKEDNLCDNIGENTIKIKETDKNMKILSSGSSSQNHSNTDMILMIQFMIMIVNQKMIFIMKKEM